MLNQPASGMLKPNGQVIVPAPTPLGAWWCGRDDRSQFHAGMSLGAAHSSITAQPNSSVARCLVVRPRKQRAVHYFPLHDDGKRERLALELFARGTSRIRTSDCAGRLPARIAGRGAGRFPARKTKLRLSITSKICSCPICQDFISVSDLNYLPTTSTSRKQKREPKLTCGRSRRCVNVREDLSEKCTRNCSRCCPHGCTLGFSCAAEVWAKREKRHCTGNAIRSKATRRDPEALACSHVTAPYLI